jgi:hypothetical protein
VSVKAIALQPTELLELDRLVLKLSATYQLPGQAPVTIASQRIVDIHDAMEGPELLRNGDFAGNGDPWFTWVSTPQTGVVSISEGELKVGLKQPATWFSAGAGQKIGRLRSGGRYRVTLKAANTGGAGLIHFQVGIVDQKTPAAVLINGKPNQDEPILVGATMKRYTVEFVVPQNLDLARARLMFCLGDLRDAHIDDVSMREVIEKTSQIKQPEIKN